MKPKDSLFKLLIIILLLFQGCDISENRNKATNVQKQKYSPAYPPPIKTYLNIDSLRIKIPGKNNIDQAEIIFSTLPKTTTQTGIREIVPGISYIQQTIEEKLVGESPVKSEKPEVIKFNHVSVKTQHITNAVPPIITKIKNEILIPNDSISFYEKIVREQGLISIQHNDSIFPPLSCLVTKPIRINSLPFRYKDDVTNDISILDYDQGLPNPFIRAISMDKRGVLWFATFKGGLVTYDGNHFAQYMTNMGFAKELTLALLIDKKGNIWTGTTQGVNCFDGKKVIRYTKKQGLPSNNVFALIEDSENNIWFATDEGVSVFNGETLTTYTKAHGLPVSYVYSIFEDDDGNIWCGTFGGGLAKFDGETFTIFTEDEGLASNIVLSIAQDHLGHMWFGTMGGGVSEFDGETFTNYSLKQGLPSDVILSIIEDANNNMCFGTYGYGLSIFNGRSFTNYSSKHGLSDNYIRAILEDHNGNLWLGTDIGITKFNNGGFNHFTKIQEPTNNITAIYQDKTDKLWYANYENGVVIYDEPKRSGKEGTFAQITTDQGLAHNIVNSIMQDNKNNYWFGTYGGGVSKLDGDSFENGKLVFTNYSIEQGMASSVVKQVLQDNKGNMWFATDRGVNIFDGEGLITITSENGLGADKILCVLQDNNEAIWFGTMGGGVTRLYNDTLTRYTTGQGLGDNTVWVITQDNNGLLWFGTDGGGLSYFDGNEFCTLNTSDGLCNDHVFSITCDSDNSLWVGTFEGLSQIMLPDSVCITKQEVKCQKSTIINYKKMDGLKGLDFYTRSSCLDNSNRLWWGTDKALTMLDLNAFKSSKEIPIVHLNEIIINDHSIDFSQLEAKNNGSYPEIYFSGVSSFYNIPNNLSLPFKDNHLTFKFTAIDWIAPNQIKYQYKLLGLDKKWSLLSKGNMADYRNITPGNYVFMVKAIGKAGKWSNEFEYPFIVRWPIWLSWWAIMLYAVTFILLIIFFIRWRLSIVKGQKHVLESMVARRTKDLDKALLLAEQATNAKSQFLATITHEIRTPLNAIMGLTHLALENMPNKKQEAYLQNIDRSASTMLSLINDILDFSKIEVGKMQLEKIPFDIEIVLNSVIIMNAHHAWKKNLDFIINIDSRIPGFLIGDPLRIGQVITNLCNNAIKFTPLGEIVVNIELDKKLNNKEILLKVAVSDTGIGIEKDKIPFLFKEFEQADNSITRKYGGTGLGLSISKLLINMMDGHIWLKSRSDKGSTFFFDFKVEVQSEDSILDKLNLSELEHINVLICDSNPSVLNSLRAILNLFVSNVDTVITGEEVLYHTKNKHYDLLIISQTLEGINGKDTIVKVNKILKSKSIKSILMTNSDSGTKEFENEIPDVSGYLYKPFLPSVVFNELLTVFGFSKVMDKHKDDRKHHLKQIISSISTASILIVEDNELNMQVIIELIDRAGMKIDTAVNGVEAVEKTLNNKYDLIFMDLHMPVMDGYNATMGIREFNTNIPIIATTADSVDSIGDKCKKTGFDDIVTKPINPDLLYEVLLKWIEPKEKATNVFLQPPELIELLQSKLLAKDLNIDLSIRRFGDNDELFYKMLKKFISDNSKFCIELSELVKQGDFEKAKLKIHTLKGESANIGAEIVHDQSKLVEQDVVNRDIHNLEINLALLKKKFEYLMNEVQSCFKETEPKGNNNQFSVSGIISKLIKSLKENNPKAFDLLDRLNESDVEKSELEAINNAVNSGDYDEAFILLEKLSAVKKD